MRPIATWVVFVALAPLLAGCVAGAETLENEEDRFRYRLEGAGGEIDKTWSWKTRGGDVRVAFSMEGASGEARLTVQDPDGKSVYSHRIDGAGEKRDVTTLRNMPSGAWQVRLVANGVAGELDVELERVGGGGILVTGGYR